MLPILAFILLQCGEDFKQGERLYEYHCSNCHMSDGQGLRKLIPPVADNDYYRTNLERIPCIIRYGLEDSITVNDVRFNEKMAGIESLSVTEITNIINYMHSRWYPDLPYVSTKEVEKNLLSCDR